MIDGMTRTKVQLLSLFLLLTGALVLYLGLSNGRVLLRPVVAISGILIDIDSHKVRSRSWYTEICIRLAGNPFQFCRDVPRAELSEFDKASSLLDANVEVLARIGNADIDQGSPREVPIFGLRANGKDVWDTASITRQFVVRDFLSWSAIEIVLLVVGTLLLRRSAVAQTGGAIEDAASRGDEAT